MKKTISVDPRIRVKTESELLSTPPVIIRVTKFDEPAADKFSEDMAKAHNSGQPIIPVVIDSYGGQCYSLMSMLTEIQEARLPVATIVEGKAMSCGALLFGMGTRGHRYAGRNATIMIHDVSSGAFGKVEEVKADAKETERLNKLVYTMLATHCGKSATYFLDIVHSRSHADWYLTAPEAKKHGLADFVGVPELQVSVNVGIDLKLNKGAK
jgi:ATP-dependent Clp endopeptidase proteolytic subunit ClpP